jgi:hypothetical protein
VSGVGSARSLFRRTAVLAIAFSTAAVVSVAAQETVSISFPLAVSFQVADVSRSTSGTPDVTTISFSNANLSPGKALRVSVQSDASAFTPPSGSSIPAANVSWNNLGASGGIGWNGTLGSASYVLVYQSDTARTSGHVDLGWTLAAPGSGIRAGSHQLTIRWKVESITP